MTKYFSQEVELAEESCASCGKSLELVFSPAPKGCTQFREALEVCFRGGYGMYMDPLGSTSDLNALLCKKCADGLIADHPWMEKLLDGYR